MHEVSFDMWVSLEKISQNEEYGELMGRNSSVVYNSVVELYLKHGQNLCE